MFPVGLEALLALMARIEAEELAEAQKRIKERVAPYLAAWLREGEKWKAALLRVEAKLKAAMDRDKGPGREQRLRRGRLAYLPGFLDVWLDDAEYFDLRDRAQARACLQYLVDAKAFNRKSARHLIEEIDPYVRKQCNLAPLKDYSDFRIHHYFNPTRGRVAELGRALIRPAGRNGRYYLELT